MSVPRATGLLLAALGALGVVAGLLLPWARTGALHPAGSTVAGLVLLVPLLGAARVAYGHLDARAPTVVVGIATLIGGVVAIASAHQVDPASGVRVGGPVTVAGALLAALGWALIAVLPRREPPVPRIGLIAGGVVVVLLAGAVASVAWATDGRFVDERHGSASAVPAGEPDLARQRWQRSGAGGTALALTGAQVVVTDPAGAAAFAARTGRPTWHYRRTDLTVTASVPVDGALITVYGSGDLILVTAHETATGAERFTRWYSGRGWHPAAVLAAGRLAVLVGSGVAAGDVVALDTRTGAVRWTWRPERDGGPCDVTGAASVGGVVGLALRCRATGVADAVVGLSTADGRPAWQWRPAYTDAVPRGAELTVDGADGGFFVRFGDSPRHAVFLDAAGTAGTPFQTDGQVLAAGLLYVARPDGGEATSVDPRSGRRLWRTSLPSLIGWLPVAAAITTGRVYLLLTTHQPAAAFGPLHVVALDRAGGAVIGNHDLSCPRACTTSVIAADDHSVVVATAGSITALGSP